MSHETRIFKVAANFLKGQLGYIDSNGKMALADSDAAGTSRAVGVAANDILTTDPGGTFIMSGPASVLFNGSLSPAKGGLAYTSATAGKAGTSNGTYYREIGTIIDTSTYATDSLVQVWLEFGDGNVSTVGVVKADYSADNVVLVGTGAGTYAAVTMSTDRVLANDGTNDYVAMAEATLLGRATGGHINDLDATASQTILDGVYTADGDVRVGSGVGTASLVAMTSDRILANDGTNKYVAVAEQRMVGRITGGHIKGMTAAEVQTLLNTEYVANQVEVGSGAGTAALVTLGAHESLANIGAGATNVTTAALVGDAFTQDDTIYTGTAANTGTELVIGAGRVVANVGAGLVGATAASVVDYPFTAANEVRVGSAANTGAFVTLGSHEGLANIGAGATNATTAAIVGDAFTQANAIYVGSAANAGAELAVAEQRIVGRITGGNVDDLTAEQVVTLIGSTTAVPTTVGGALVGHPVLISIDCEAAATPIGVFNANCPFEITIDRSWAYCSAASAGGTAKLNDAFNGGGNDITDAATMAVEGTSTDHVLVNARRVLAAGSSLSVVKNAAGDDGFVYILGHRSA